MECAGTMNNISPTGGVSGVWRLHPERVVPEVPELDGSHENELPGYICIPPTNQYVFGVLEDAFRI